MSECNAPMAVITSRDRVQLEDRWVHYSVTGSGPRTIILVHGWGCNQTVWKEQVPSLCRSYRVITFDLPGHGQSDAPARGAFSMDLFTSATDAVVRQAGAERVVLAGHSMGALIGLRYAAIHPENSVALVLAEGVLTRHRSPILDPERLAGPDGKLLFERIIRTMLFSKSTSPAVQEHILSMMLNTSTATTVGVAKALLRPEAWTETTQRLPILGLYRHGSRLVKLTTVRNRFPNFRYVELDDTGHFLMLERAQEFNRMVREFLEEQTL